MRQKLLSAGVFLLLFLAWGKLACAQVSYTVRPGDSLYLIGQAYGLTPEEIMAANNLTTTTIWPGQVLLIPGRTRYVVRAGDTLFRIAQAHGTTVAELMARNNLTSTTIYPGQELLLPVPRQEPSTRFGVTPAEIYLLARLIRAEAEGEPFEGQVAVGAVVLNRLRDARFPKTITEVIFDYWEDIPQFEPVLNGRINLPPDQSSLRAAYAALQGVDPTGGALFFYNPDKSQSTFFDTCLTYLCRIGNHVFYR